MLWGYLKSHIQISRTYNLKALAVFYQIIQVAVYVYIYQPLRLRAFATLVFSRKNASAQLILTRRT